MLVTRGLGSSTLCTRGLGASGGGLERLHPLILQWYQTLYGGRVVPTVSQSLARMLRAALLEVRPALAPLAATYANEPRFLGAPQPGLRPRVAPQLLVPIMKAGRVVSAARSGQFAKTEDVVARGLKPTVHVRPQLVPTTQEDDDDVGD